MVPVRSGVGFVIFPFFLTSDFAPFLFVGTRTGGWTAAKNVIAVTSVQKIVKTLEEAHERVNKFCVPLEATRYNLKFGWPGAAVGTSITFASNRPAFLGGDLHVVLIKKELVGF
jgi:hypothetical protein